MKKTILIIALSTIILANVNVTFWQLTPSQVNDNLQTQINNTTPVDQWQCPWSPGCPWYTETMNSISNNPTTQTADTPQPVNGITINEKCLTNGQCKFNIYETLGIRSSVGTESPSVGLFVQDIVLSATFFIWTIVTVALIVSGVLYIFAAASGKDPGNAKKWITGALIGLVIVACSYFIIRLVQYLAKGV